MRKTTFALVASVVTLNLMLAACATPAPPPVPTTPTTPKTSPTTPTPKASPAPTVTPAATPQYGGVFKLGSRISPRGFYPGPGPGLIANQSWPIYDGLMRYDAKGNLQPWLATDWKLSTDLKSLTLTLRKGIKFHDGTDFNAAAAKSALEERKAGMFADLDSVTSISIIDDYSVRLNLSAFQNTLFNNLASLTSWIYSPTAVQKNGREWAQWNPVGTGPFKFVRYDLGQVARYERFDAYWQKGKPYLDGVHTVFISDETTLRLAFEKGEVDALTGVATDTVVQLRKKGKFNEWLPLANITALYPDSANADSPFANRKVREAVDHAIDSMSIAEGLGYGTWEGSKQIAASSMPAYVPGLDRKYDTAKAKQLLAEAGYPNGFKTTVWARTIGSQEALVAVVTYLKAVGIDAELQIVPISRYVELQQRGWKNSLLVGAVTTGGTALPDWLATVNSQFPAKGVGGGISIARSSAWQALLEQALVATDPETQKQLSQQLVRMNHDEAMAIVAYIYSRGFVAHKNARNAESAWSDVPSDGTGADIWLSK
ncbi:MAG: ABC transporter substrate-binding protein [Chloroflexi bacterium]|nr:ABC transporter substrate-binding protein [Chloroflexota bacterium]